MAVPIALRTSGQSWYQGIPESHGGCERDTQTGALQRILNLNLEQLVQARFEKLYYCLRGPQCPLPLAAAAVCALPVALSAALRIFLSRCRSHGGGLVPLPLSGMMLISGQWRAGPIPPPGPPGLALCVRMPRFGQLTRDLAWPWRGPIVRTI